MGGGWAARPLNREEKGMTVEWLGSTGIKKKNTETLEFEYLNVDVSENLGSADVTKKKGPHTGGKKEWHWAGCTAAKSLMLRRRARYYRRRFSVTTGIRYRSGGELHRL